MNLTLRAWTGPAPAGPVAPSVSRPGCRLARNIGDDDPDSCQFALYIGIYLNIRDRDGVFRAQFQFADQPIPVGLCPGVVNGYETAKIDLAGVVHADGQPMLARRQVSPEVVDMRGNQAVLRAHQLVVYPDGRNPVRTFEEE